MGRERKGLLDLGGTDAVLHAVLSACLGQYRRNEAQLLAALDGETLHQARASLRRLRSALRLFQPLTSPQLALEAGLRDLSGALGAARDLDVLLVGDDLVLSDILQLLLPIETLLGRKINPTCYTPREYTKRLAEPDSFVNRILAQPTLPLIGDVHAAQRSGELGSDRPTQS